MKGRENPLSVSANYNISLCNSETPFLGSTEELSCEYCGDGLEENEAKYLRIGLININGLPDSNTHEKNHSLYKAMEKLDPDIIGLVEVNQHWQTMSSDHQWRNRTMSWWEMSHSAIAYNIRDVTTRSSFQPGGVILQSINKAVYRITKSGRDNSGLGRWAWTMYRGKQNITLRVICAYRPCIPSSTGSQTTYVQQQRVFDAQGLTREPRQAILNDLGEAIKRW